MNTLYLVCAGRLGHNTYGSGPQNDPVGRLMSAAPRPETQPRLEPFRLRGANFNLLVLRLLDPRPEAVVPAIGDQFRRAPGFLRFAPIVIGLGDLNVPANTVDFQGLIEGLRGLEIVPIGTTGGTPEMRNAAMAYGLPPIRSLGGKDSEEPAAPAPAAAEGHFVHVYVDRATQKQPTPLPPLLRTALAGITPALKQSSIRSDHAPAGNGTSS